jgi:hypothetical protein
MLSTIGYPNKCGHFGNTGGTAKTPGGYASQEILRNVVLKPFRMLGTIEKVFEHLESPHMPGLFLFYFHSASHLLTSANTTYGQSYPTELHEPMG